MFALTKTILPTARHIQYDDQIRAAISHQATWRTQNINNHQQQIFLPPKSKVEVVILNQDAHRYHLCSH
ncbi:hypothetical protein ES319_D10G142100v1 [Gossypium barbadense]|uniref:Uncharacterized protein n=1 Tax=Gossypium barbadense TaxID=3634 RepID=A0A5J5PRM9_GOSBA|nr:hypothetical protein ES319_D10G142100v1 [Gossypium barbadense]